MRSIARWCGLEGLGVLFQLLVDFLSFCFYIVNFMMSVIRAIEMRDSDAMVVRYSRLDSAYLVFS